MKSSAASSPASPFRDSFRLTSAVREGSLPPVTVRSFLPALFLLALAVPLFGGGKKPDPTQISFHAEGAAEEGPKMTFSQAVGGRNIVFRRSPEIQTKDIAAFRPFQGADGTFGATFLLKPAFHQRLLAATSANQGKWMLAMFNGRPADVVRIDAPVKDGQLVIWQGIQAVEMQRMAFQWPLIGETSAAWKERKKTMEKIQKK